MMDGSTKILTVSYGTFSCTLEGFDDPLGAMRDIAEYFRDLAGDDRYFGAEPPTPDPEMLQNIAEKEVNRRVEARLSDTGVALRQVAHEPSDVVDAAEPEAEDQAEDAAQASTADDAKALDEDKAVAARVVSAVRSEDEDGDADAPILSKSAPVLDTGSGPLTFDDDFLMSDEPEDVLAIDPTARVLTATPAESVAEKLRRIRAVVSKNLETSGDDTGDDLVEDAPESLTGARDRAQTETIEAIAADISDDENAADVIDEAEVEGVVEDAAVEADDAVEAADVETDAAARDTSQPLWGSDDEGSDGDVLEESEIAPADDDVADSEVEPEGEASAKPADTADGADESSDEEERSISDFIDNVSGRLAADADEDDADDAPIAEHSDGRVSKSLSDAQESDVGRLMAETDTKLNEDEVVRRRRVISQMRAAVAATKADRLVTRQPSREVVEQEEQSPYREDLSEAVREQTKVTSQPDASAPPLVLVSSQRVDESEDVFDGDAEDAALDGTNFADFATTMGAKELPELLEAAAAFTVFGEGQSSFTRPEIMKRVAAVDPTIKMSREESLRSFGQLLRQGKFRKLERGQFTIDNDTRFHPKRRAAG